jgi:hypothetical protein
MFHFGQKNKMMAQNSGNTGLGSLKGSPNAKAQSAVDRLTGDHTIVILVSILVAIIIIAVVVLLCVTNNLEFSKEICKTIFAPAILTLVGFFAGYTTGKKK